MPERRPFDPVLRGKDRRLMGRRRKPAAVIPVASTKKPWVQPEEPKVLLAHCFKCGADLHDGDVVWSKWGELGGGMVFYCISHEKPEKSWPDVLGLNLDGVNLAP